MPDQSGEVKSPSDETAKALIPENSGDDDAEFRPAGWFSDNTKVKLPCIRQAALPARKSKHVRKKTVDNVVL